MLFGVGVMAVLLIVFAVYFALESGSRANAQTGLVDGRIQVGQELFTKNCMACHGENATGGIGPALNSQQFLGSIISTGIPGSQMSSYLQEFGGPLTADEIHSIVGYLRSLEENAPDRPDWRDMLYGSTTTTAAG